MYLLYFSNYQQFLHPFIEDFLSQSVKLPLTPKDTGSHLASHLHSNPDWTFKVESFYIP